jgi:thiamine transporter ThiT
MPAPADLERKTSISSLALVASMAALGNLLGVVSVALGRIPTPGVSQVALDFSSVPIVVMAIFFGWRLGSLTGLIAGIGPAIMFASNTGPITILFPVGKAITGFTIGIIAQSLKSDYRQRSYFVLLAVWIGFIPEAVLTWFYFQNLVPLFVSGGSFWAPALAIPVLIKGWFEMTIIGFLTVALVGNEPFKIFLGKFVPAGRLLVPLRARK